MDAIPLKAYRLNDNEERPRHTVVFFHFNNYLGGRYYEENKKEVRLNEWAGSIAVFDPETGIKKTTWISWLIGICPCGRDEHVVYCNLKDIVKEERILIYDANQAERIAEYDNRKIQLKED